MRKHLGGRRYVRRPESEWVRATAPRLVSDATFEAAKQAIHRNGALTVGRPSRSYLLSGLVRCMR
jgi:hypothetical protein